MGLMVMAIFSENSLGMQGVMMQMFNHGINIIGLWIVVELIESAVWYPQAFAARGHCAEGARHLLPAGDCSLGQCIAAAYQCLRGRVPHVQWNLECPLCQ
jgi:hypothetical protein